ncbi:MAG TPA: type II toxin-antitoxin system VapC family toxin [Blastocatellia bacterium]
MPVVEITGLCIDTSPLIAYLRGQEPAATAVSTAVRECTCLITSITVYELLFGVSRARRQIGEEALLGGMSVLSLDASAARRAAHLHDYLIKNNADVGIKDVLIAAICLENSVPLFTLNHKHFARIPGLSVLSAEDVLASFSAT